MKEQPKREDRILFQIVVDAYGTSERAMGWYCYLEDKLKFPFAANCVSSRITSPLDVGSQVEVFGLAPEDDCMLEIFVLIRYGSTKKFKLAVPLAQLQCLSHNEETCQAVEDWHYWVARGYVY
ncbi:calcium-binding protein [Ottowia sp.]|uniref:calcium-binding protein n=1 Tax=Ottowia sp. TaxID=1898956 RepID=UPI003A88D826